jgi:proteic killer suppression protein
MIKSFRHKGLALFFASGKASGIPAKLAARIRVRLAVLDKARALADVDVAGYRLHPLKGDQAGRWAIDINGPWRITFEWEKDNHVCRVDLEQYH